MTTTHALTFDVRLMLLEGASSAKSPMPAGKLHSTTLVHKADNALLPIICRGGVIRHLRVYLPFRRGGVRLRRPSFCPPFEQLGGHNGASLGWPAKGPAQATSEGRGGFSHPEGGLHPSPSASERSPVVDMKSTGARLTHHPTAAWELHHFSRSFPTQETNLSSSLMVHIFHGHISMSHSWYPCKATVQRSTPTGEKCLPKPVVEVQHDGDRVEG